MEPKQKSLPTRKTKVHYNNDDVEGLRQWLANLEVCMTENLKFVAALQESQRNYRIPLDESSNPIFKFYPNGMGRRLNETIGKKDLRNFPKIGYSACLSDWQVAQKIAISVNPG